MVNSIVITVTIHYSHAQARVPITALIVLLFSSRYSCWANSRLLITNYSSYTQDNKNTLTSYLQYGLIVLTIACAITGHTSTSKSTDHWPHCTWKCAIDYIILQRHRLQRRRIVWKRIYQYIKSRNLLYSMCFIQVQEILIHLCVIFVNYIFVYLKALCHAIMADCLLMNPHAPTQHMKTEHGGTANKFTSHIQVCPVRLSLQHVRPSSIIYALQPLLTIYIFTLWLLIAKVHELLNSIIDKIFVLHGLCILLCTIP